MGSGRSRSTTPRASFNPTSAVPTTATTSPPPPGGGGSRPPGGPGLPGGWFRVDPVPHRGGLFEPNGARPPPPQQPPPPPQRRRQRHGPVRRATVIPSAILCPSPKAGTTSSV